MRPSGTLHNRIPRRIFFRNAGLGAAVIAGSPFLARSCSETGCGKRISSYFSPGDVILFQGDSITDAGRNRERELPNDAWSFGTGYAMLIASWLLEELAQKELTIYNRGISGNKVFQLAERWDKDCLFLHPDVLSILIGVNDYWHMLQGSYEGTADTYENDYRALLTRTREQIPDVRLVICQPFILADISVVDQSWVDPFKEYQKIAEDLADEFEATWVPFQEAFSRTSEIAHPTYWTFDGVHPSMAGAQLMAETWLAALSGA
jgi:lysophospholipase L1-like esterase